MDKVWFQFFILDKLCLQSWTIFELSHTYSLLSLQFIRCGQTLLPDSPLFQGLLPAQRQMLVPGCTPQRGVRLSLGSFACLGWNSALTKPPSLRYAASGGVSCIGVGNAVGKIITHLFSPFAYKQRSLHLKRKASLRDTRRVGSWHAIRLRRWLAINSSRLMPLGANCLESP